MAERLLSATNLTAKYGPVLALNIDRLDVGEGDVLAIVGPSGAGKSTLLRCLSLLQPISSGEIIFRGKSVFREGAAQTDENFFRRQVRLVQQEGFLWLDKTVIENAVLAQRVLKSKSSCPAYDVGAALLEQLGLGALLKRFPNELSGGQRQRVALARSLIGRPALLLLDEPTNNIDDETLRVVLRLLQEYRSSGGTIVMATHHVNFLRAIGSRWAFIEGGRLIEQGALSELGNLNSKSRASQFVTGLSLT